MEMFTDILTINPNIIKVEPDISNPKLDYATLEAIHAFRPPFKRQSMCLSAAALRYEDLPYAALTALKILQTVNSGYSTSICCLGIRYPFKGKEGRVIGMIYINDHEEFDRLVQNLKGEIPELKAYPDIEMPLVFLLVSIICCNLTSLEETQ